MFFGHGSEIIDKSPSSKSQEYRDERVLLSCESQIYYWYSSNEPGSIFTNIGWMTNIFIWSCFHDSSIREVTGLEPKSPRCPSIDSHKHKNYDIESYMHCRACETWEISGVPIHKI